MIRVLWVEAKDGANSLQCTRQSPRQRTIRPKIPIELMPRSIVPAEKTINLSMDKKTAASNQGNGKMEQGDQIERETGQHRNRGRGSGRENPVPGGGNHLCQGRTAGGSSASLGCRKEDGVAGVGDLGYAAGREQQQPEGGLFLRPC